MIKQLLVTAVSALVLLLFQTPGLTQTNTAPIVVEEFSYQIPQGGNIFSDPWASGRVVFALNDSINGVMSASIAHAMEQRWGQAPGSPRLVADKATNMLGLIPKFKPKLKKTEAGKVHLFFRVVDYGNPTEATGNLTASWIMQHPDAPLVLDFYCKAIDGSSSKEIFSKEMRVIFDKKRTSAGLYQLQRLPGTPASFIQAFDSAVHVFFGQQDRQVYTSDLQPACIYISAETKQHIQRQLKFENTDDMVKVDSENGMQWSVSKMKHESLGKVKGGSNVLGGAITMFTGLSSDKTEMRRYQAVIKMKENTIEDPFEFRITYIEEENSTRERVKDGNTTSIQKTQNSTSRYLDKGSFSYLLNGKDTVAKYVLSLGNDAATPQAFHYYWDGSDSSSIRPIPESWKNTSLPSTLLIKGTMYGQPFAISNSRDGHQLDMMYEDELVATLSLDNDRPRDGVVYTTELPAEVVRAFAMFTCVPYSFFRPSNYR